MQSVQMVVVDETKTGLSSSLLHSELLQRHVLTSHGSTVFDHSPRLRRYLRLDIADCVLHQVYCASEHQVLGTRWKAAS
jgi:hypothetical protein